MIPQVAQFTPPAPPPNRPTPGKRDKPVTANRCRPASPSKPLRPPVRPIDLFRLSPGNPTRPASWRWQLATRIADGVAVPRSQVDPWVEVTVRFARRLAHCRGRHDREELRQRMPHQMAAYELFTGRPPDRSWIEALILTREAPGAIAEELGVPPEVVRAYMHLFFDLEGRLKNAALVHQVGIGLAPGQPPGDPAQLWKLLGFLGGREIVRCLVGMTRLDLAGSGRAAFELAVIEALRDELDLQTLISMLLEGPSATSVKAARLRRGTTALVVSARDRLRHEQEANEGIRTVLERYRGIRLRSGPIDREEASQFADASYADQARTRTRSEQDDVC
jgi:hypothetical protein